MSDVKNTLMQAATTAKTDNLNPEGPQLSESSGLHGDLLSHPRADETWFRQAPGSAPGRLPPANRGSARDPHK